VALGAVNGPRQTVLTGPVRALGEVAALLHADGFTTRALRKATARALQQEA